jgi:PEP-CTERM motif
MRQSSYYCVGAVLLALSATANAGVFRFDTDPFAGTNVLNVPGRQIVGGEDFISFSIASDVFSLESTVFEVGDTVDFVNAPVAGLPAGGVNIVALQTFDDDNNPLTPFGAGQAANLIASKVTTPGAGFFIYFNQALDLPRLVYSTDLSSQNSDLKILARILNLNGAEGRNLIPTFTASNFTITTDSAAAPEPSTALLALPGLAALCCYVRRRSVAKPGEGSRDE